MESIQRLIRIADAYKIAAGITEDTTVSHRVFGDTKKLAALRAGAGITVARLDKSFAWFADNWPAGHPRPAELHRTAA